ncbi:rRNA maturation RNase YbeY [Anoxybacter fermentans]|uniref:Endoribonuclease YbeY n=1 Tax=Anoxybacter fermentans TaxID=1323375 RepID=A0A3Q9HQ78_9FIRM|nr:rRNA maturation RNase YbeY [Anoxybacter fermentans]AZR73154.1 rRNA maturation RNase YbeY [Anoxybacter fermentans]
MEILINNHNIEAFTPELEDLVRKVVQHAADVEDRKDALEVSILITNNAEIQKLNAKYRQINAPTDVLSFPMDEEYLGDIVISMDKVIEQAEEYGHSIERELAFLTVHGMLHLFGYDHIEEEDRVLMRQREEEILNQLGIYRE